jgi:hypothetical protein
VLALFATHYADYGPTLASEKLHERHRIEIHPETLRLWLRQARLPYKQRKARPHRQWRRGGAALARGCSWTDRIMTGWKGEARSWS